MGFFIMSVPSVQIKVNDAKVEVFWELDTSGVYLRFKLYYDIASDMSGETAFSDIFLNTPNTIYSSKHVFYSFDRSEVTSDLNTGFYLRVKGVKADASEVAGATRYIPGLDELAGMENVSKLYGYDATNGVWRKVIVDSAGKLDTV